MTKSNNNQEKLFDEYAYDWWNKTGNYKLLHKLNPLRLEYISSRIEIKNKKVLDIGCGGGILSEELCKMGAKVTGAGSDQITIEGVENLKGTEYSIPADRIEAGTYLAAAAVTNGNIKIDGINPKRLMKVIYKLEEAGASIIYDENSISISMKRDRPKPVDITTAPFPELPTDMQAQNSVINAK